MGWAGANSNAAVLNVAGSQEVVTSLTGLGDRKPRGSSSTLSRATAAIHSTA
jgi:hypothetical protein